MRGRTLTVRTIALLGAGSAAIHQLRYAIGYGDGAARALAAHPHGYLDAIVPGIATALLIAIAAAVMRIGAGSAVRRARSLTWLWVACATALGAIYGVQETLEGAGAVLGGGWIGFALAIPAGLLVALAIRGADAAEALSGWAPLVVPRVVGVRRLTLPQARTASVVRYAYGARGPPLHSVV